MKIKRKGVLKDIMYHEAFDRISIFPDGDWALLTTGTYDPYAAYIISRNTCYNQSRRSINRLVKYYETLLNEVG